MLGASSLYRACDDRFASYPLAVESADTACSMVLMDQNGNYAKFFILTADHDEDQPSYSIRRWRSADGAHIGPGADSTIPGLFANAVLHGVPIPRNGSLLGWD